MNTGLNRHIYLKVLWHVDPLPSNSCVNRRQYKQPLLGNNSVDTLFARQRENQLPADVLGTLSCKSSNFRKKVRKVINKAKWRCGDSRQKYSEVKWSYGKGREVKWSKLWWGCEGYVSVVKWNEGKIMVKCGCISSWHNVFHYCYCIVYLFLLILIYIIVVVIVFVVSLCVVCPILFV
jgi:hypothetical protein